MALLTLTWSVGYIDLGSFNLVVALAISICKASLVALFFMHIKGSSRLLHLAAAAGIIWLIILLSFTLGDYFTRTPVVPQSSPQLPSGQSRHVTFTSGNV